MADITENKDQAMDISISTGSDLPMIDAKEWDAVMELALLNAISRCKPVGIHKHFRIISVQRQFNQNSPVPCTIKEIWQRLGDFYGMSALDELEEEDEEQEEEEREEQEKKKGDNSHEFSLPLEDYEQLISEHRQDNNLSSRDEPSVSPELPPAKRTRTSKRDSSPTNSVTESNTTTPEPEEEKPSRRTSRGTRKSEATPEPSNRNAANRRTGRSSSGTIARGNSKRPSSKRK